MSSFSLPSPLPLFSPSHKPQTSNCFPSLSFPLPSLRPSLISQSSQGVSIPQSEGGIPLIDLEECIGKDWSFLESDDSSSHEESDRTMDRIISAGGIGESSRVLVSMGSQGFVDRLVGSSPCGLLLVVHESLLELATIKEKYDNVKCWQGELIYVPEKWAPFDAVFLYFLPGLPFELPRVLESLAKCCSPGASVVISHHQGRQMLEQQRQGYPNIIVSDLPERNALQNVAAGHSFEITAFVDEPGFYLAVLMYQLAEGGVDI